MERQSIMTERITYYYAIASGFAYLGEPELRRIARQAGLEIDYRPVDIRKVFLESATIPPPEQSEIRLNNRRLELARWGKRRNMPVNPRPAFWPVDVKPASLAVLAAQEFGYDAGALSFALLRAVWAEERNIAEVDTIREIAEKTLPQNEAMSVIATASDPSTAETYDRLTAEATASGVFGSPTYIVRGELFFGQDRLDFVAEALGVSA
jgi:2-hydroxychromene-2-carboxylate isomerase